MLGQIPGQALLVYMFSRVVVDNLRYLSNVKNETLMASSTHDSLALQAPSDALILWSSVAILRFQPLGQN